MMNELKVVTFLFVLGLGAHVRAEGKLPPPGEYVVQADGSSVGFSVTELLVNTVHGTFHTFAGKVSVGDSLASTRIEATADVASVDTRTKKRDEHLRTAEWLDAQQFPKLEFKSTSITGTPGAFTIKGNLTIKGVTKEVSFASKILDGDSVEAETTIHRSEFGITTGKVVKDEVHLHLKIRMTKAS